MKLRNKIILYFSTTIISLLAVSVWVVYLFFANYRQNEFDQRLEDKILTTTNFLVETQHINHQLLNIADEADVKGLDKEEVLIYDHDKHLIYSSIHDTKILFSEEVLGKLNTKTPLIETESGEEEIVGRYVLCPLCRHTHYFFAALTPPLQCA
ncbi:MAG: hypothetical protein NTX03_09680 [Bacteroidetes bacterium]|nr:hypothetical protein [Bacteroidota bacterium]